MAHRIAHLADKAHLDGHILARINSAIIFGLIGGGLFACVLGALVYDIGRVFAVWYQENLSPFRSLNGA
jgi:hypothetical protein